MHQQNTFSDIECALALTYSAQPVHKDIIRDENPSSEGKYGSKTFDGGGVGKPPTSSWPTQENHAPGHDGSIKHQKSSSVELKMACTWSEEEEHVRNGRSSQVP